jgi:hypothetical protein
METLDSLMQAQLDLGGVAFPEARDMHMEVIDTDGLVWMSIEVVTQSDFDNLTLDDSLRPVGGVGVGVAAMDAALFKHSPSTEGKPMRERIIDGHRFINVAIPGRPAPLSDGLFEIMVNKAHVLGYKAGRTLAILSLPEGDFVEVVGDADHDDQMVLPQGGSLGKIELKRPWIVDLPTPTKTIWQFGAKMRSFQGPVILPEGCFNANN